MKVHDEFNRLSDAQQATMWRRNVFMAMAITTVMLESSADGNEQLSNALGHVDMAMLCQILAPYQHQATNLYVKKISVRDINQVTNSLDPFSYHRYCLITDKLKPLVADKKVYKTSVLAMLFHVNGDFEDGDDQQASHNLQQVAQLERKYLTLLSRKMTSLGNAQLFETFQNAIDELRELAEILKELAKDFCL